MYLPVPFSSVLSAEIDGNATTEMLPRTPAGISKATAAGAVVQNRRANAVSNDSTNNSNRECEGGEGGLVAINLIELSFVPLSRERETTRTGRRAILVCGRGDRDDLHLLRGQR